MKIEIVEATIEIGELIKRAEAGFGDLIKAVVDIEYRRLSVISSS